MMSEDEQNTMIAMAGVASYCTTSDLLHRLWTAHCSGFYDKAQHKPLWQELQRRIERERTDA